MNSQNTAVLVMALLVTLGELCWEETMGSFVSVIEHRALIEIRTLRDTNTTRLGSLSLQEVEQEA